MLEAAIKSGLVKELGEIVGSEFVSTSKADLYMYSQDMTYAEPSWPDIVVLPKSAEEVQAIIRLANKDKIPVTPYLGGGNIGGLTIPLEGGISLDLKRMNRIIEVNETDMYAIVECGVTLGDMKGYLDKNHPKLIYSYAFSPPSTGVVTNALVQGLATFAYRYGTTADWISGLEVVLPEGDLVRIGSCGVSKGWQSLAPLPELAGLFVGWQGTTGIVTKMAVNLWPRPKFAAGLIFYLMDLESSYEFLRAISRTRIPDDVTGDSYALREISRLSMEHKKGSLYPALILGPDEPEFRVSMDISANTENELKAKVKVVEEMIKGELKGVKLFVSHASPTAREADYQRDPMQQNSWDGKKVHPQVGDRQAFIPMQAVFVLSSGGGLYWVGTYGPMSNWLEAAKEGCALEDKYNITRSLYTRLHAEGHYVAQRWMLPYNKKDPEMVERVKALSLEISDMAFKYGYIPYKTPVWEIRRLEERASPEWLELHRKVKKMLDPNNILNPGRWGAPQK